LHPFERVANFEVSTASKGEQAVGKEFDVVAHHSCGHSNELNTEGINHEFHFNCAVDDLDNACRQFNKGGQATKVF
jgi:hypothetical protein